MKYYCKTFFLIIIQVLNRFELNFNILCNFFCSNILKIQDFNLLLSSYFAKIKESLIFKTIL